MYFRSENLSSSPNFSLTRIIGNDCNVGIRRYTTPVSIVLGGLSHLDLLILLSLPSGANKEEHCKWEKKLAIMTILPILCVCENLERLLTILLKIGKPNTPVGLRNL